MRAIRYILFIAICFASTSSMAGVGVVGALDETGVQAQAEVAHSSELLQLAQKKDKGKRKGQNGRSGKKSKRANGEQVPARGLNGVIKSQPRFRGAKITSVFVRRPARTSAGFMYEVWVRSRNGSETIVYVDPSTRRILYEVPGRRR